MLRSFLAEIMKQTMTKNMKETMKIYCHSFYHDGKDWQCNMSSDDPRSFLKVDDVYVYEVVVPPKQIGQLIEMGEYKHKDHE